MMSTNDHPPSRTAEDSAEAVLESLASGDRSAFLSTFRRLKVVAPEGLTRAAVVYLAKHHLCPERAMVLWLSQRDQYLPLLFDREFLALAEARRVFRIMRDSDPQFWVKAARWMAVDNVKSLESVKHGLDLLASDGEFDMLVPSVRQLERHSDPRIRSLAAKWLYRQRPHQSLIERQLRSKDPRVRADAVEALWTIGKDLEIFQLAAADSHHRVAANALLGLHYGGDDSAVRKIVDLAAHPSWKHRAAAAWALGRILDGQAIRALETLAKDPVATVRKNAENSLALLSRDQRESSVASESPPRS